MLSSDCRAAMDTLKYRMQQQACGSCSWRLGGRPTPCRPAPVQHWGRSVRACSHEEDEPVVYEDWRQFRAKLVASQTQKADEGQASKTNMQLLELQSPALASEGCWAHPAGIEQGGILLATLKTSDILLNDGLEQVVVFLVSHGPEGSMGVILNRPTSLVFGRGPGGLRFELENTPPELQDAFASSRVYCGGWTAQQVVHVMHPNPIPDAVQVVQGIYMGGEKEAARMVTTGKLSPDGFKFFSGALVWESGQLEREVQAGCWYTAACSRSLVLKQCLQLPTPLWREILLLMGKEYADVAAAAYEGDEVSGESVGE